MYLTANQLEVSGGMRRDRGECLIDAALYLPPAAIQRKGNLYIIAEIEGATPNLVDPGGHQRATEATLCRETQMTVMQEFYNFNPNATITSALRHALQVANQQVFNRNSAMLPPDRRGVGLSCALVRGQEVFLAQVAPTQAFLTHKGQLKMLPNLPEMVRGPRSMPSTNSQDTLPLPNKTDGKRGSEIISGLGRSATVEPSLSRHVFEENDLLILCSSNIAEKLTIEQADNFFLNQDSRSALFSLNEFTRTHQISDGYVMAVGAKADYGVAGQVAEAPRLEPSQNVAEPASQPRKRNSAEGVAASVSMLTSKFAARNRPTAPTPPREEFVYQDRPQVAPSDAPTQAVEINWNDNKAAADSGKAVTDVEDLLKDDRNNDPWLRREEDNVSRPPYLRNREVAEEYPAPAPAPRNFTYNEGGANQPGRSYMPPQMIDEGDQPAPPPDRKTSRRDKKRVAQLEASPVNSPYVDLVGVDGYGPPLEPGRMQRITGGKRWPLILALLALLAVAVLFLVFAVGGGVGGGSSKALEFVKAAEQKRGQAQALAATNPAQARKLIEAAKQDLALASKEKADLADINSVQNGLKITLDNINKVVVPPDLRLAVDLTSQGAGVKITQAVLSGDIMFLLDSGRGIIYATDLAGSIKPLLKTGDAAGGSVFGKPLVMTARMDSIVVLDEQNISYIYNRAQNNWTAAKLGDASSWVTPVRQMATYQGNLYLIGPGGGQILKYNPGNYVGNPDEWVNPSTVDSLKLDKTSAFAIDGSIYTLSKEGRFLQLARPNGKPKGEVVADIDLNAGEKVGPAINNPLSMQVGTLEYPFVFVVDSEKRVLQFQKETGNFIQQFRATPNGKEFDNLRDVAIDTLNNKLYLIGEQKVYVFRLPAETAGPVINATVGGPTTAPISSVTVPSPTAKP